MKSVSELIKVLVDQLAASQELALLASALKNDEPATGGKVTVKAGNEYVLSSVPFEEFPFVFVVLGSEKERVEDFGGTRITREIFFFVGIVDSEVERGTYRVIEWEEAMVKELDRILWGVTKAPGEEEESGLIYSYQIGTIDSDIDVNRPYIIRGIRAQVSYILE